MLLLDSGSAFRSVICEALLFPFEQLVQFLDQLQESMAILLDFNHRAQLVHALAFFRCHRQMG